MGANGGEWGQMGIFPGSPRGRMGANGKRFWGAFLGQGSPWRTAANGGEWGRMGANENFYFEEIFLRYIIMYK